MGTGWGSHHCLVKPAYTARVGETAEGFRRRARFEAGRNGSDPWVFVRELLQNARDAGATEVRFKVEHGDGREWISCRDDGSGMTFEHARQFLFTLYASSKLDEKSAAGQFGVGFWSVLRFEPDLIKVRSRPADDDGWELRVDGGFRSVRQHSLVMQPGTEVILERPESGEDLASVLRQAISSDARYLRRRDQPTTAIEILVNGEPVAVEVDLPSPNVRVDEPGLRLTAALTSSPQVEVFAHGLRVRNAAFLDELLLSETAEGPASSELPDGLLPRVVLDSDRLQVLLARGEAREDATLRRLVQRAEREVGLLVGAELDQIAGPQHFLRWFDGLRRVVGGPVRALAAVALLAAVVGLTALGMWWVEMAGVDGTEVVVEPTEVATTLDPAPLPETRRVPYRDLEVLYAGPSIDVLADGPVVDLRYWPEIAAPLFVGLRIGSLGADGVPVRRTEVDPPTTYRGPPCTEGCLEVELRFDAGPGIMQLPVASGHRIDPDTVSLDGDPVELWETALGDPVISLDQAVKGLLRYVSGPASAEYPDLLSDWPDLPVALADQTAVLSEMAVPARVAAATQMVAGAVAYDRSQEAAHSFGELKDGGLDLLAAAVEAGVGDCDVQNALLAAVLDGSGIPAWLAVGYVGADGHILGGLHAWVEYLEEDRWVVADASAAWDVFGPPAEDGMVASPELTQGAVTPPEAAQAPTPETRGLGGPRPWLAGIGLAALVFAVGAYLISRRRSSGHTVEADGTVDLTRLLRGAILRPRAFSGVDSLYSRRLVPSAAGRRLSLSEVMRRAGDGRLFRSDHGSELARRVSAAGEAVIDSEVAEGAVVADLLGARDIDAWSGLADRAEPNPATDSMEEALQKLGERWSFRVAEGAPDRVSAIEGRLVGLPRHARLVVVDAGSGLWTAAAESLPERPAWTALVLADGIADTLDLGSEQRRRWLAALARAAVVEGRGGSV